MYETFYGLSGKPFQLSPDPDFFYGSRGHRRAMAYLEYGLHQAEGFIVVTGEVGAGKSTLVQELLRRLPSSKVVPVQIVTTQLEAEDLVRIVASSFGLQYDAADKSTLLIRLEQYLRQLHAEGRRALLIVDEAQNLGARAIEELRMLSNFQIGTKAVLQSFLLGQPELRELMQRPQMRQLKQRIIAAYHLGPLDQAETQHYIEHRLKHVGWKGDPSFDAGVFDRIFGVTNGIPRRINSLMDRLLLGGFLAGSHSLGESDVNEVASELRMELGPRHAFLNLPNAGTATAFPLVDPETPEAPGDDRDAIAIDRQKMLDLDERVAMLESTTAMIFSALKKVLRLLRIRTSEPQRTRDPERGRGMP
ncbi:MAG TPA: XrtA/PEP-CTERM system-associated ATPase [Zeimonas sp.]|nr:XrtA/PEP-CTERM system-associated ATPase [Zeimonas sp.]